jgi:hypothetical protein
VALDQLGEDMGGLGFNLVPPRIQLAARNVGPGSKRRKSILKQSKRAQQQRGEVKMKKLRLKKTKMRPKSYFKKQECIETLLLTGF